MVSVVEDPMAGFLYALSSPISKAVYRVEESVKMHSFIVDALQENYNS